MNSKFVLALIALVGVGVFALPSTMALFAGQHSFYNIDATGNQIPCQKCHGDVKSELQSNKVTGVQDKPNTNGPHYNFKCEYCHRAEAGYASGDNGYGLIGYSDGTNKRALAISVYDFEAKNYPETIGGGDVINPTKTGAFASITFHGGAAVSAATGGTMLNLTAERLMPTYNRNTGAPLDTNTATQNSGLNLTAVGSWDPSTQYGIASQPNLTNAGSKAVNPGTQYHAASLVSCMECHRGDEPYGHYTRLTENGTNECQNCHYGSGDAALGQAGARWTDLAAGGFNLTDDPADTGASEAHNAFVKVNNSVTGGILRYQYNASNAACVACHTHVAVDINFTKRYMLSFDATGLDTGKWNLNNYKAQGTVLVNTFGNASGQTFAVGNHSYTWPAGSDVMPDLYTSDGTPIKGLSGAANDSAGALTSGP